jgi:hypothetical protein
MPVPIGTRSAKSYWVRDAGLGVLVRAGQRTQKDYLYYMQIEMWPQCSSTLRMRPGRQWNAEAAAYSAQERRAIGQFVERLKTA